MHIFHLYSLDDGRPSRKKSLPAKLRQGFDTVLNVLKKKPKKPKISAAEKSRNWREKKKREDPEGWANYLAKERERSHNNYGKMTPEQKSLKNLKQTEYRKNKK